MKKKPHGTHIVGDCGCQYNTGYPATVLSGATTDCHNCGALLIFPSETTIGSCVRGRYFHVYMNEQWDLWPADGNECYSVGVGGQ